MNRLILALVVAWACELAAGYVYIVSDQNDSLFWKGVAVAVFCISPAVVIVTIGRITSIGMTLLPAATLAILVELSVQLAGALLFRGLAKDVDFRSTEHWFRITAGLLLLVALYLSTSMTAVWVGKLFAKPQRI